MILMTTMTYPLILLHSLLMGFKFHFIWVGFEIWISVTEVYFHLQNTISEIWTWLIAEVV